ncbi:hypothetical protein KDA_45710 [Dictyobacter alpinus]|uniref:Uncharacterized protein n=1 Tax=Dictyobacter alpinus TaxID=2014873 RepID=A0A402BCS4_9CHLR|nr:hypothetical protein KDA_45710 [Dictyobacter alpinus]
MHMTQREEKDQRTTYRTEVLQKTRHTPHHITRATSDDIHILAVLLENYKLLALMDNKRAPHTYRHGDVVLARGPIRLLLARVGIDPRLIV